MKLKNACLFLWVMILIASCNNDEEDDIIVVPPRLLSEVAVEDEEEIVAFLKTHFYNFEEFENPPADFDYKIRFDTIAGENSNKESIFNSAKLITQTITRESSSFGRNDGETIAMNLYTLVVREGVSEDTPTVGDYSILNFTGELLNGDAFDGSTNQPTRFYLSSVVPGFGNGVTHLKGGTGPIENGDGTVSYENYGIGAIFMPSGLGYFDRPQGAIPAYAPLVFKIDLLDFEPNSDFDEDGIPSILEDFNKNGDLSDDNTDVDEEPRGGFLPDHLDPDDDGDGIPTIEEINLDENGKFLSFRDTDKDGIFDHLDKD